MIEQGIVKLIQSGPAVIALTAGRGGTMAELLKDETLPSWSYRVVSQVSEYTLTQRPSLVMKRFQIDAYGATGGQAVDLAHAIDGVLSGYHGTLTDVDSTVVNVILQTDEMDFFDDARRSWRKMLEYEVYFFQT